MITKNRRSSNHLKEKIPVGITVNNTYLVFKNNKWVNASKLSENQRVKLRHIVANVNPYNIDEGSKHLSDEDKIIFQEYVLEIDKELSDK